MPPRQHNNGHERIARLEEHNVHTDKTLDAVAETLTEIKESVAAISLQLAKSKSFLAGISFVFAGAGGLIIFGLQWVAHQMGWVK